MADVSQLVPPTGFSPYGLKTSTEENRKGYPDFPVMYEQKSKLTMLEIWSVILNRSI
jgi:hypothetical protein